MAARPRSRTRRDWPKGLRESKPGYFVWDNPITGSSMAIGRVQLADAKMQALEANLAIAGQLGKERLVDRLNGEAETTLSAWLTKWLDKLEAAGDLAANTVKSYRSLSRAVEATDAGGTVVRRCTVKVIADALEEIEEERGARTAQAVRSMLKTAFTAAIGKGLCENNPAVVTEAVKVTVQRQRFTWETFSKVWKVVAAGDEVWLRNAVALALVSAQRREDVADAVLSGTVEDPANPGQRIPVGVLTIDGVEVLRLIQGKTKRKLEIPLDIRLDVFGMSLRDVVADCRRTGVVSRYLVHQTRAKKGSKRGAPIFIDTISKRFTEAVVAALGKGDNLPTLHELRSLAKRLYEKQGGVDTKTLLGHSTERMGELYRDARGAEFERVRVG